MLRILVADDEELVSDFLEDVIQMRLPGVAVDVVRSGAGLRERVGTESYAVIFSDNDMEQPGAGLDALRDLRRQGIITPFYLCSGLGLAKSECESLGGVFVPKPISMQYLCDELRKYVG